VRHWGGESGPTPSTQAQPQPDAHHGTLTFSVHGAVRPEVDSPDPTNGRRSVSGEPPKAPPRASCTQIPCRSPYDADDDCDGRTDEDDCEKDRVGVGERPGGGHDGAVAPAAGRGAAAEVSLSAAVSSRPSGCCPWREYPLG
jgi:hypothetical protein